MQTLLAFDGWQCPVPVFPAGFTAPGVSAVSALPAVTEHCWQFEKPVAPSTDSVVGDEAHPSGQ